MDSLSIGTNLNFGLTTWNRIRIKIILRGGGGNKSKLYNQKTNTIVALKVPGLKL
jgi:hypothetical protein